MTEPEIDEAAAWAYASNHVATMERYYPIQHRTFRMQDTYNLARAALRWKARAEAAERMLLHDNSVTGAILTAIRGGEVSDFMESFSGVREAMYLRARAEAAEAERDSLRRQLAQSVKAR